MRGRDFFADPGTGGAEHDDVHKRREGT